MNALQNAQNIINNFAEANSSELAQEFAAKLGQQTNNSFNSEWNDKAELEQFFFSDHDSLEQVCSESEADFSWNDARDLQRDIVEIISNFYSLV